MTGLVFVEQLSLSYIQWIGLLCNTLIWLFPEIQLKYKYIFSTGILLTIFWGVQFSIDTKLTWDSLQRIQGYSISQTLDMLGHLSYLKYQPSAWTIWLQWNPSYHWQQIYMICISGIMLSLYHKHYGVMLTNFIAATPLFQLMSINPSNDMYALFLILLTINSQHKLVKVCFFVIACCTKYTTLVLLPFVGFSFGWYFFTGLFLGGIYISWGSHYFWGTIQWKYLLHSFSLGFFSQYIQSPQKALTHTPRPIYLKFYNTIVWRWKHLGQATLIALPFYLFPLYCRRWRWQAYLLMVCLLMGYGNVKYFILLLPLLGEQQYGTEL